MIRTNECREKWLRHDEIRLSKKYPYSIIQQDNFVLMSTLKHTTLANKIAKVIIYASIYLTDALRIRLLDEVMIYGMSMCDAPA